MKKLLILLLLFYSVAKAQTGIGTTSPNASAKLDVYSTNKGFLPPRVSLTGVFDVSTITSPATGLLVYCTGTGGLPLGYYFWNGTAWATIATEGGSGSMAAEFGTQMSPTASIAITSATPLDILSFTLPSGGTWEVTSFVRTQGAAGYAAEYALYDASDILVPNSEILPAYGQVASTGTGVIRITTTGAATYKLKAWASTAPTYNYAVVSDGNGRTGMTWQKISGNAPLIGPSQITYGDVKTGFQASDHSGWIKLNGRAKSTLTSTQQAQATALGIGSTLPNADGAFLVQNGRAIGDVFGANTKTIAQANLPNVQLGGSTSYNGNHTHTMNVNDNGVVYSNSASAMKEGQNNWTSGGASNSPTVLGYSGDHNHSITTSSINGGVTQTSLDITPKSLSVNTFIYLGY